VVGLGSVTAAVRRSRVRYSAVLVRAIVLKISPRAQSEDFPLADFSEEDEPDFSDDFSDEDDLVFAAALLSEPPLADEPLDEPLSDEGAVEEPLVEDPLPADSALGFSLDLSPESSPGLALPARA
jgi:hypothetical protein